MYTNEWLNDEYLAFCEIYGISPDDENSKVLFESLTDYPELEEEANQ